MAWYITATVMRSRAGSSAQNSPYAFSSRFHVSTAALAASPLWNVGRRLVPVSSIPKSTSHFPSLFPLFTCRTFGSTIYSVFLRVYPPTSSMSTLKQATTTHNSGSCETAWKLGSGLFTDGYKRFVGKTDGGAEGVRTPDLLNAIQALYQLSYDPIRSGAKFKTLPAIVKTNLNFCALKFLPWTLACASEQERAEHHGADCGPPRPNRDQSRCRQPCAGIPGRQAGDPRGARQTAVRAAQRRDEGRPG